MKSSVKDLMKTVKKAYGESSITTGDKNPSCFKIPLGNPSFDYVTTGGIPLHQLTEFVGRFSSTKTLHTYLAMAQFQRIDWSTEIPALKGISKVNFEFDNKSESWEIGSIIPTSRKNKNAEFKYVAFIDTEGTYDKDFASTHGVWQEGVIYSQPTSLEESVELLLLFLQDESISLIVFDSMSALADPDEANKSMEEHTMASNAKFWNKAIRKVRLFINSNPNRIVTLIMINSMYSKVGMVMGDPDVTRNGEQMQLAKGLSVKFTALKEIKSEEGVNKGIVCGRNVSLRNLKNKFGEPRRNSTFFFSYLDEGVKKGGHPYVQGQVLDIALKTGLVNRKGAWYEYGSTRTQGQDNFLKELLKSGDYESLYEKVYKSFES